LWNDGHVNLRALTWPLTPQAWWLIGSAFLTYLAWSGVLAMWRPTPVWAVGHGPSRRRTQLLQWVLNLCVGGAALVWVSARRWRLQQGQGAPDFYRDWSCLTQC